jgi:hypothetical protein
MPASTALASQEFTMNPERSVIRELGVDRTDLDQQFKIGGRAPSRWTLDPFEPVIEARSGNP